MKKVIKRKIYDTDTAKQLAFKYVGEFGEACGYEERLYITKRGLYFIFGCGGSDSPYSEPTIKPITKEHADEWETETNEDKGAPAAKTGKAKRTAKTKTPKAGKTGKPGRTRKSPAKKTVKPAETAAAAETAETAAVPAAEDNS
ncbi:MAG: hypothetical protein FWH24_01655 [Oscillospiraceae bacterium]|nr:hypothetical protein [Oscillospiraceae bacterium]